MAFGRSRKEGYRVGAGSCFGPARRWRRDLVRRARGHFHPCHSRISAAIWWGSAGEPDPGCADHRLLDLYQAENTAEWQWFEEMAMYDNPKLSHAMILSGHWTSRGRYSGHRAAPSLRWLLDVQTAEGGHFSPIGCHGFWARGAETRAVRSAAH